MIKYNQRQTLELLSLGQTYKAQMDAFFKDGSGDPEAASATYTAAVLKIKAAAKKATLKGKSLEWIAQDAKAVIYHRAFKGYGVKSLTYADLDIDAHVAALQDFPEGLAEVEELFKRFKTPGAIPPEEAAPYADYEEEKTPGDVRPQEGGIPAPDGQTRTNFPAQYIYSTDAVTKRLLSGKLQEKQPDEVLIGKDKSGAITLKISLDYKKLNQAGITFETRSKSLAPYDQEVLNAVFTLRVEGENRYIRPEDVYKVMIGDPRAKCPPAQLAQITETLEMLRLSLFYYDWTELARYRKVDAKLKPGKNIGNSYILELSKVCDGLYYLEQLPLLYRFAACLNQIGRMPLERKRISGTASTSKRRIKSYLLTRIDTMRARTDLSRNIRFDSLIDELKLLEPQTGEADDPQARSSDALKKARSRIYKKVEKHLEEMQKDGTIKGFTINYSGRKYESVTIEL